MAIDLNPYIQQLSWAEARELILPVNPEFVQHVDELELPKECGIFKVKYRYGDYLLKDGQFMLRNTQGDNVSIDHPDIPEIVKKKLSYAPTVPMGINLNKSIETYFSDISGRLIPLSLSQPGTIFALAGVLAQEEGSISNGQFWNITAGNRTVYSLPKISIGYKHKKLAREFGVGLAAPKNIQGHWSTFKELMHSPHLVLNWELECLFFSQEFPSNEAPGSWKNFNHYLRSYIWDKIAFLRNLYQSGFIISQVAAHSNLRCSPNLISWLKQLVGISGGFLTGLSFQENELSFPHQIFKTIYKEIYELTYSPRFMTAQHLRKTEIEGVFYSLAVPSALEYFPDANAFKSKFDELRDMAYATKKIQKKLKEQSFGISDLSKSIFKGIFTCKVDFYHSEANGEFDVKHSSQIPELRHSTDSECPASSLLRGVVRIGAGPKEDC